MTESPIKLGERNMASPLPETDMLEEDLYATLNVEKDATAGDLRTSFRKLSQKYHPDKHIDEEAKVTATGFFTKIKEAYEILSSDKLRRIYNEFGIEAARAAAMPGMELVPYSDLAERFRNDAGAGNGSGSSNAPRDAYFTVTNSLEPRVDATGLVVALEEGDVLATQHLAVFTQVGVSTMATAYVSQNNTVAMRYALAGHGSRFGQQETSGVGEAVLSWRRQIDQYMHLEGTAYMPLSESRTMSYGFKAFRALSPDMTGAFEATLDPERRDLTTALTYSRAFDERRTASVSWAYGATPGYAFSWRRNSYDEYISEESSGKTREEELFGSDDEDSSAVFGTGRMAWLFERLANLIRPMGWRLSARWNFMDPSIGFFIKRPIGQNFPLWEKCDAVGPGGSSVRLRGQLGLLGWEVEVGGGRKYVLADTAWGTSVAFGTMGVVWRLKISRSGHRFSLPVVLHSSTADPKTATVAAITTSLFVSAIQILFIGPWQAQKEQKERQEAKERRASELERGRSEAESATVLLRQTVERVRKLEEEVQIAGQKGSGLLIERAIYGLGKSVRKMKLSDENLRGREIELEMTEVTDAVQALVANSVIQVVSATKSTITGFWDPSAFGEKEELVLRIWYFFKGDKHECIIRDNRPIELPVSTHRVESWD